MIRKALGVLAFVVLASAESAAQSSEEMNGCMGTTVDPCERTGTCTIQGAAWFQTVTISRSDIYDTMGWPGVCDQVHVALVQGRCDPGGAQLNVSADLASASSAFIPEIVGPLSCNAPPPVVPMVGRTAAAALAALVAGLGALAVHSSQRRLAA